MSNSIDKIKLIYEFDHDSPLFVRVAESEIKNGNVDDAVEILENGLREFPDYTTGYLVYAEALTMQKKYDQVIEVMEEVKELIDDEKTINHYLEYFEDLRNIEEAKAIEETDDKDDYDFGKLAERVQGAKIPKVDESEDIEPYQEANNKSIVSETLAGIYFTQGNYDESLEMYERLVESCPGKAQLYEEKIEQIKAKMEEDTPPE